MIAALIGVIAGGGAMFALWRTGMLAERSGLAVLLAAVAAFYPVFTAQNGDFGETALHIAIFAAFSLLAADRVPARCLCHRRRAHFDAGLYFLGASGPVWWPYFAAHLILSQGAF